MNTFALQNTPHEALTALARFVKRVRLEQCLTQEELATRVGVGRSTIDRFEKTGAGSTNTQMKVFAALGTLDIFVSSLVPPEKPLTIAELKKMSDSHQRQRARRKKDGLS